MRILLDAHVSGPRVGGRLAADGHDVRSLDQEPRLEGLEDEAVLALAADEQRILITHDVADFPPILRRWALDGRPHAGVILVYGVATKDFATVVEGIERWLERHPTHGEWRDLAVALR